MNGVLNEIKTKTISLIPNIIAAIIVFIIGMIIVKILKRFIIRVVGRINTTESVRLFIIKIVNITMITSISIIALSMLGVPVGAFAAIFGAVGVGLSIVFKESLSNLGAGFLLIFITKPFKVNDYIAVSSAEGKVGAINLFSTALNTTDNKTIRIPNSKLLNENILNYSNEKLRRIDIKLYVENNTTISILEKTIHDTLKSDERILVEPEPVIGINQFTPLGLNIIIGSWVRAEEYWSIYYDLMKSLKENLDKNNIKLTSIYNSFSKK